MLGNAFAVDACGDYDIAALPRVYGYRYPAAVVSSPILAVAPAV
jgi:hypothetical protein